VLWGTSLKALYSLVAVPCAFWIASAPLSAQAGSRPFPPDPLGIPGRVPLDSLSITLVRSDYFERTPTYEVSLLGSGEVVFTGDRYFDEPGPRRAEFDPTALVPLLQRFYDIKFFELAEGIPHRREAELILSDSASEVVTTRFTISDNVHEVFTVRIGAYSKTVYNRYGGSPALRNAGLGQAIDSIAGVSRWTGND